MDRKKVDLRAFKENYCMQEKKDKNNKEKICQYCGGKIVEIEADDLFLKNEHLGEVDYMCEVCGVYQDCKIK